MGLDIVYSSGEKKYRWPLSMNEFEALNILAKKGLKELVEPLLGVEAFGKKAYIEKGLLIKAIEELLENIEKQSDLLPFIYDAQVEIPRGSGKYSKGGQGICGLDINNEQYDIETGFDKCFMTKKWMDEKGEIHMGDPIDIRDRSEIKTDQGSFFGDVKIVKKKLSKGIIQKLGKLKEFISKCEGSKIVKILG